MADTSQLHDLDNTLSRILIIFNFYVKTTSIIIVGNPNGVPEVSVGNPNGVPEVSHVVSNVAETDAVSKERFSRSSTVSFALDSPIGGVSTVHNRRSSTVQFPVECGTLGLNSQAPGS